MTPKEILKIHEETGYIFWKPNPFFYQIEQSEIIIGKQVIKGFNIRIVKVMGEEKEIVMPWMPKAKYEEQYSLLCNTLNSN